MAGHIPETQALNNLSDALNASSPDKVQIQKLLDAIKVEHPDVYERLKGDNTSIIHEAENHLKDLRNDLKGIVVPGFILGNADARANMEKFGKIRDGIFTPENEEVKRDFEEYKDLMGFIENTPRNQTQSIIDMEGLVSRYEKLLAPTNSRFIKGADYLTAMYGEALYEDIIARGFIHKRDGDQREYEIVCPKIEGGVYTEVDLIAEFPNHPYLRLLKRIEVNDMMDMMAVGSIMVKDKISYRGMDLVGQDDLIKTILAKHKIKGPDGRDILNPQLLLVHWKTPVANGPLTGKTIEDQILEERHKLVANKDDGGSWQAYQELQYLLDFMENEDYLDTDRSLNMFQFANQYRKAFLGRQAYIDAGGPDGTAITEKNIMDHLGEFAKGNTLAALGVAFVAWFTGHNKTALFATIFGLMGGKLADAGSDALNQGKNYANSWTKEQLGILDPQDVRYNIKTPAGIEEADVTPQLDKLFAANEGARDNGGVDNAILNGTLSNAKVAKIYQSILGNDPLLVQGFSNDTATVNTIRGLLGTPPAVTAGDFDSIVPASELGPISDADITSALTLMENTLKEEGDTSFGDIVFNGIDPLKKPYTPVEYGFVGESSENFESSLNTTLANARTNATSRKEIGQIEEVKSILKAVFVSTEIEGIGDFSSLSQAAQSTLFLSEAQEANEAIQRLTLIPAAQLTIAGVDYKTELIGNITKYRNYNEVDEFLNNYDGTFAKVEGNATDAKNWLDSFTGGMTDLETSSDILKAIRTIDEELLKFASTTAIEVAQGTRTVDISTDPVYTPLLERFNREKQRLERAKRDLEAKNNALISGAGMDYVSISPEETAKLRSLYEDMGHPTSITRGDSYLALDEEVDELKDTLTKGVNTGNIAGLSVYISTYGGAYAKAQSLQAIITPFGTPSNTNQTNISNNINSLVTNEATEIDERIKLALTDKFANAKRLLDDINAIPTSLSGGGGAISIASIASEVRKIEDYERQLKSDILGIPVDTNLLASSVPTSEAEKALTMAKDRINPSYSVPNEDVTARAIFEEITEKRTSLAENINNEISTAPLDKLVEMYDEGVIAFLDSDPGFSSLRIKETVRDRIEELTLTRISGLSSVEVIVDFTEDEYEKIRPIYAWSIDGITGNLTLDTKLAEKLKTALESEINALTLDAAGLATARELAETMEWMPRQSTLGRWRDIFGENFTDFTGFFPEDGVEKDFNDKLEDIRKEVMKGGPGTGSYLHSVLDSLAASFATSSSISLASKAQQYRDGTLKINQLILDSDFKDLPEVVQALKDDFLVI